VGADHIDEATHPEEADAADAVTFSFSATGIDGPAPARSAALGLEEQARLTGAYRWTERRLFELLGAWVADERSEQARVLFDLQSQQHAWHSQLFGERLPVLDWIDPEELTRATNHEAEQVLGIVGAAESTLLRLVGIGRFVLPRLVTGYTLQLERASTVADAPLRRALRLVLRDEIEAWQASELMLQGLVRDSGDADSASQHLACLETVLAGSGPGLFSGRFRALRDSGA